MAYSMSLLLILALIFEGLSLSFYQYYPSKEEEKALLKSELRRPISWFKNSTTQLQVLTLLKELSFKHPIFIQNDYNIGLLKEVSKYGLFFKADKNYYSKNEAQNIVSTSIEEFENRIELIKPKDKVLLITNEETFPDFLTKLRLEIHQEIYIYQPFTGKVFETYEVNQRKVVKTLGMIDEDNGNIIFKWQENIPKR